MIATLGYLSVELGRKALFRQARYPGVGLGSFGLFSSAPLVGTEKMLTAALYRRLEILDAKSHFLLWTIVEPMEGAYRKTTWQSNLNTGVTNLVSDLKNITGEPHIASK